MWALGSEQELKAIDLPGMRGDNLVAINDNVERNYAWECFMDFRVNLQHSQSLDFLEFIAFVWSEPVYNVLELPDMMR